MRQRRPTSALSARCRPRPRSSELGGVPRAVVRSGDPPPHSRGRHRCRRATNRNRCCVAHPSAEVPPVGSEVCPGVVLATLLLQSHLTAPRGHLQGVEVPRLLVGLQGPPHAVSPRRDDGFIGDLGSGSGGLDHYGRGSHGSWDHGSPLLRVALMLEVADSVGWCGVLRLRRYGQRLDGRGAVIHVFVCRDWRDAHGAPHQPHTNESDHPVLPFVALDPDDDLWRASCA